MKTLLLVSLLLISGTFAFFTMQPKKEIAKDETKPCCSMEATASFASLADDQNFINKHENPLDFTYAGAGEKITFKTPDGKEANAFLIKSAKKSKKYLFVFQEWWGLNDHIKQEAEKYFNDLKDVNVIALDMYDGKVATKAEDAGKYMQEAKKERLEAIIKGAIQFAGKKAKIATVGWCFGGGLSLQSSIIADKQAVGCIIYYGMPEKDKTRLATLKTDVLGIFASKEQWISPAIVAEFDANMKEVGKKLTLKNYDADHAFANPSNPKFNKEFADDAYKASIDFLKSKFN